MKTLIEKTKNAIILVVLVLAAMTLPAGCGGGGGATGGSGASGSGGGSSGSSYALGTAVLSWTAPATLSDGSPITGLAGYAVYYGTTSGAYTSRIDVGNVTSYTVNSLPAGTYYFAATAYNTSGDESVFTAEVSKTIN